MNRALAVHGDIPMPVWLVKAGATSHKPFPEMRSEPVPCNACCSHGRGIRAGESLSDPGSKAISTENWRYQSHAHCRAISRQNAQ